MPRIYRTGGVNVSDDVLRIKDIAPVKPPKRPAPSPVPAPADGDEEQEGVFEAYEPEQDLATEYEETEQPMSGSVSSEIIQSAMAEASRILEDAMREAEAGRADLLAGVQQEAELIQQNAAQEGQRQGFASVVNEVQETAGRLEQAVARFEGDRAAFEVEYEEQLKWLAMEIAGKVLAKKVSEDDAEMLEMVDKAVQSVRGEPWIRVEVAQEMAHLIDRLTALYDQYDHISVSAIPAETGTVHVETPSGVVDASLRTQLSNLRDYFSANLTENAAVS